MGDKEFQPVRIMRGRFARIMFFCLSNLAIHVIQRSGGLRSSRSADAPFAGSAAAIAAAPATTATTAPANCHDAATAQTLDYDDDDTRTTVIYVVGQSAAC